MAHELTTSHRERLKSGKWFHGLDAAAQDRLLEMSVVRSLHAGQRLFSQGDPPSGLYAVLDGTIRLVTMTPDGREVLLALARCPTWLGEIALFDGQPRSHDAISDGEARVLHVPEQPLIAWLDREPRAWRSLGILLTLKMRLALGAMEEVTTLPLGARLAKRIVIMAEGWGDARNGSSREVSVKQEELATMLWTSRQTVNRSLKELEAKGLIGLSYGKIELVDLDGLRREAEGAERE